MTKRTLAWWSVWGLIAIGCDGSLSNSPEWRYYGLVDEVCGAEQCSASESLALSQCIDSLRKQYHSQIAVGCEPEVRTLYQCLAGKGCAPSPYECPSEVQALFDCEGEPPCLTWGDSHVADDGTDIVTSCNVGCVNARGVNFRLLAHCESQGREFRCWCGTGYRDLGPPEFFIPNCLAETVQTAALEHCELPPEGSTP